VHKAPHYEDVWKSERVEVKFHIFLTLALGGGEQLASCLGYFVTGE